MFPLLRFSDTLSLPTYLVIISAIYCAGLLWIVKRADKFSFDRNSALDLSLAIMLGGFVGARFFHIVYEAPDYYWRRPLAVFEIWRGGFVFYGGVIGAFVATELVFRRRKLSRGDWQDLFTPLFPLGYAFGRFSCLFAGCCFGRPTHLPWAITFPPGVEAPAGIALHPTQLYAFLWEMSWFGIVMLIEKKKAQLKYFREPGSLFCFWLISHGFGRLMMEYFRADNRGPEFLRLSVSSWLSLLLIITAGYFFRQKINCRGPNVS